MGCLTCTCDRVDAICDHGHHSRIQVCIYWNLSQIDKSTLSYASILGLFEETGINSSQYNNLNTMFYVGASYSLTLST
jgi:hypothetical protein